MKKKRCWAADCDLWGCSGGGLCAKHMYRMRCWTRKIEEEWTICCFKKCGGIIDPQTATFEFPVCPLHLRLISHAAELEEWGIMKDALPWVEEDDWLSAKWVAAILGFTDRGRKLMPKVYGETPLFRVVTSTLSDAYRLLPELAPA